MFTDDVSWSTRTGTFEDCALAIAKPDAWARTSRTARGSGRAFAERYEEDFAFASELGLGGFEVTLPWSRIEPRQGHIDDGEIERYRLMLVAARAAGLRVTACLLDNSTPGWFNDLGGFGDSGAAGYSWPRWIDCVAESCGDLVDRWVPIHAVDSMAINGWLVGSRDPHVRDFQKFSDVVRQLWIAHRDAHRLLRGAGQDVVLSTTFPFLVAADDSPEARQTRTVLDDAVCGALFDALNEGIAARPGAASVPIDELAQSANAVAVSAMASWSVDGQMRLGRHPLDAPTDARGQSIWPGVIDRTMDRLTGALPKTPLIAGSVGIATLDEVQRIRVLHDQLSRLSDAAESGAKITEIQLSPIIDSVVSDAGDRGLTELGGNERAAAQLVRDVIRTRNVPTGLEPYLDDARTAPK